MRSTDPSLPADRLTRRTILAGALLLLAGCGAGAAPMVIPDLDAGAAPSPSPSPTPTPQASPSPPPDPWEKEISAYERADRKSPPPTGGIVFVGSSTIRLWKTLERDFPGLGTLNRGFGGSQIHDATRLAGRIVLPYAPRQVVLFAGTNDIHAKKSARQVAADFAEFALTLQIGLPNARLSFIEITSSPSRWGQRDTVVEANGTIESLCKRYNADFIPARAKLLGADGAPRPELFIKDQLHLNADGYKILTECVRPFLTRP